MRLQRLTSLEVDKIIIELNELKNKIEHLGSILANYDMQSDIIHEEFTELEKKYGDSRRTEIKTSSIELG